ncbi:F-box family protein [Rhynchospora pubera]|uniref:F-box family protein n=1 Tax=Rhynchospora pubera TaxID=906938 RepID=A0AAV8FBS4_9POAL|nr:F-box family protein [Rhynchospora pubera]
MPGESSWTVVDGPDCRMEDIVCFKGNFYVISAMNELYVVNFELVPKLIEIGPPIGKVGRPRQTYLMDFDGYMLLIERFCLPTEHELSFTIRFNVIEPNLEEDRLYEWFGIDDCAVFLGRNSSIFVESSHPPMCRKNSIYFTHLTEDSVDEFGCCDLGVFNMTEHTINRFYSTEVFPPLVRSPVWLTPNPR